MAGLIHSGNFVQFTNSIYGTPQGMAAAAPLAIQGIPRDKFVWGEYQQRVVPHRGLWPSVVTRRAPVNTFDTWKLHSDAARAGLAASPNSDALAPDEPNTVPATKLNLLDEAVRKAFYSNPPIPIEIEVDVASGPQHEIGIDWKTDAAGKPTLLHLTMYCPCPPPKPATASSP